MTYQTAHKFSDIHSELIRSVPTFEPLDPAETADMIGAGDDPADIGIVAKLLLSARGWVESEVQVALTTRTATLYLDSFPRSGCDWRIDQAAIQIRVPPLQSVTSIVYLDADGNSQTLSTSLYRVVTTSRPGRITPAYGQTWPYTYPVPQAITVSATIGYTDADLVPDVAKQAMRILTKMMWDSNGMLCEDGLDSVRRMLDPIRWEGYI